MKNTRPWLLERLEPFDRSTDADAWGLLASFETEEEAQAAYREALAVSVAPMRVREAK